MSALNWNLHASKLPADVCRYGKTVKDDTVKAGEVEEMGKDKEGVNTLHKKKISWDL